MAPADQDMAGVLQRDRPEYNPRQLRIGGTFWSPSVTTALSYDDNVFASGKAPRSDVVAQIHPELVGASDWGRHSAKLQLDADVYRYKQYSSQDRVDLTGRFDGVLDVRHNANIATEITVARASEQRGIDDSIRAFDKPVRYSSLNAAMYGNVVFGRFYLTLGGRALLSDYQDSKLRGVVFDQDYRDGLALTGTARLGYELTRLTSAYVEYSPNTRHYRGPYDSTGQRVVAGLAFTSSRLISGRAYAGYFSQDFRATALKDVAGMTFGANLQWTPTPLITVTLLADRDADQSNVDGSSVVTSLGVTADYELRRNLVVSASYTHRTEHYVANGDDDVADSYGLGAQYYINRNLSLSADYDLSTVRSDSVADYHRNLVSIGLTAQF